MNTFNFCAFKYENNSTNVSESVKNVEIIFFIVNVFG